MTVGINRALEWEEQAETHLNVGVMLRQIAQRRLTLMRRIQDRIDDRFDPNMNDEDFAKYCLEMRLATPTDELLDITNVITKAINIERLVSCADLHNVNVLASVAYSRGYKLVPKKDIGKPENKVEAGISRSTVNSMRLAIAGEMF